MTRLGLETTLGRPRIFPSARARNSPATVRSAGPEFLLTGHASKETDNNLGECSHAIEIGLRQTFVGHTAHAQLLQIFQRSEGSFSAGIKFRFS